MYLDTGTMIGIIIALVTSITVMAYSMYIIGMQNRTIAQMHAANSARRKRDMNTASEPTVNDIAKNWDESNG